MPSKIAPFLTPKLFNIGERCYVNMDPATQFGFTTNAQGEPERVQGIGRVIIPVYDWAAMKFDEDTVMSGAMLQAAEANPLKLPSVSHLTQPFWSGQRGTQAFLMSPNMRGKFKLPLGIPAIDAPGFPMDRLVLIGPQALAGYFIKQGARMNILCHNKRGLTSIQLHTAPS